MLTILFQISTSGLSWKKGTCCKAHYHARRKLATGERMVATRAKSGMIQCMKENTKYRAIQLLVLADSSKGETMDFNVYGRKSHNSSVHGLS